MKFKYIGLKKDGERAFREKTGIEWMPGSVHDVTDAEAIAEMRKHPTMWQPMGDAKTEMTAAKSQANVAVVDDQDVDDAATRAEQSKKTAAQPDTDPLAGLDDKAVQAFAKTQNLGIKSVHLFKGDNLRAKVTAALAART